MKTNVFTRLGAALALLAAIFACQKQEDETIPVLKVPQPMVLAAGGEQNLELASTVAWTLSVNYSGTSAGWVKLSQESGEAAVGLKVKMSVDPNISGETRRATLVLKGTTLSASVDITQLSAAVGNAPLWLEMPALDRPGFQFGTHDMEGGLYQGQSKSGVRNYSFYWDPEGKVSFWVAYPLNKSLIGSGGRTDNWDYDPKLTTSEQPTLFSAYKGSYDRGHQLPSADRLTYAENVKTFYFTNMTPQMNAFNGKIWATAESMVRGWATTCDTLYVVTGCIVKGSTKKAYDNNGKAVTVPVAYYKAVLRYMKGSTLGYSGYMGLAMYFEHKSYSYSNISRTNTEIVMSIDDLEKKIGLDLFPNLERVAGKSVSDQVEAENPSSVSYWW